MSEHRSGARSAAPEIQRPVAHSHHRRWWPSERRPHRPHDACRRAGGALERVLKAKGLVTDEVIDSIVEMFSRWDR